VGEPSPDPQGEGHGSGEDPEGAAAMDSPAYGARNVRIVAAGTGEALPGPVTCVYDVTGSLLLYNRYPPGSERQPEGRRRRL
jgi:hypothetical protein